LEALLTRFLSSAFEGAPMSRCWKQCESEERMMGALSMSKLELLNA
jgi:hypothetical protein